MEIDYCPRCRSDVNHCGPGWFFCYGCSFEFSRADFEMMMKRKSNGEKE